MKLSILSIILFFTLHVTEGYKILALVPFSGRSHWINLLPILQELTSRGHELTVITPYRETNVNYTQIITKKRMIWDYLQETYSLSDLSIFFENPTLNIPMMLDFFWESCYTLMESFFSNDNVQDFIKNDNTKFDLIFTEIFYQESLYMFAHKYKVPMVGFTTMGYMHTIALTMGSPIIFPYMVHEYRQTDLSRTLTFAQKLHNIYEFLYEQYFRRSFLTRQQALVEKNFPDLPRPLPLLSDLEKSFSLVLISTHFSYDMVRPYVPGIIEVGGVHVKPPKPLPHDLETFIGGAKHGAVFFSLGSNIQSSNMPQDKLDLILRVFSKLKQRVIWKFESDALKNIPENVMISKWLPQGDILAHPNLKLFITHGGLLSTQESMYHGVPVLVMPFIADQQLNAERLQSFGFGLRLDFRDINETSFAETIDRLLSSPDYKKKAEEISIRFRDRPQTPLETSIFWIEYIVRHKGAPHLRSPGVDLSLMSIYLFDVYTFLLLCCLLLFYVVYKLFRILKSIVSFFIKTPNMKQKKYL